MSLCSDRTLPCWNKMSPYCQKMMSAWPPPSINWDQGTSEITSTRQCLSQKTRRIGSSDISPIQLTPHNHFQFGMESKPKLFLLSTALTLSHEAAWSESYLGGGTRAIKVIIGGKDKSRQVECLNPSWMPGSCWCNNLRRLVPSLGALWTAPLPFSTN